VAKLTHRHRDQAAAATPRREPPRRHVVRSDYHALPRLFLPWCQSSSSTP